MANAISTGSHVRRDRFIDAIKKLYRKELVVRNEFARDFEGDPVAGSVKLPVRDTDAVLQNYDIANGVNLLTSTTTFEDILVDNHKALNELIDGYEAAAVPDNIVAQRLESGSYSIGLTLELNAIGELEDNGTAESSTTALTTDNAYSSIAASITEIKKLGVSINDIVVVVSPDTELSLLTDDKFANTSGTLGAELVREGVIGKIAGARTKMSANLASTTEYIVFAKPWCQAIDEWKIAPSVVDLRDAQYVGASKLQGRMVYADKLTRTNACRVKKTATPSV